MTKHEHIVAFTDWLGKNYKWVSEETWFDVSTGNLRGAYYLIRKFQGECMKSGKRGRPKKLEQAP